MPINRRRAASILAGLAGLVPLVVLTPAAQPSSFLDRLLRERLHFSSGEVRSLDAGSAVVKTMDTPVRQEMAHIGAVRLPVRADTFVERFRSVEQFERGPGVPQINGFGPVPSLADLDELTLPADDVEAARTCRPGRCDLKLAADTMHRFQQAVNWSAPDAASQANAFMRAMVLDLVRRYQVDGNAALGQYDDLREPLVVADAFRAMLAREGDLPFQVPALLAYLDRYPAGRPEGADDFFYWSVVDFGLRRTLRVNHVVIAPLTGLPVAGAYAIAIKQLYATHYFHTTLELRFVLDDDRPGEPPGSLLISVTRSRNDGMTGFTGLFVRPIVSRRSRDAVHRYLEHVRRQTSRLETTGPQP